MSKKYVSKKVTCSHYRWNSPSLICCDGIWTSTAMKITFDNRAKAKKYMENFCGNDNEHCPIFCMIESEKKQNRKSRQKSEQKTTWQQASDPLPEEKKKAGGNRLE